MTFATDCVTANNRSVFVPKLAHHNMNHLYNSVLNQLSTHPVCTGMKPSGTRSVAVWAFLRLNWLQFAMAWNALITAVWGEEPFGASLTQEVRRMSFMLPLLLETRRGELEGGGYGEELTGLW